jgi:hypothetical protein
MEKSKFGNKYKRGIKIYSQPIKLGVGSPLKGSLCKLTFNLQLYD